MLLVFNQNYKLIRMLMQKLKFQSIKKLSPKIFQNQLRYFSDVISSSSSSTTTVPPLTQENTANINKTLEDDKMFDFTSLDLTYQLDNTKELPKQFKNWAPLPDELPDNLPFAVSRTKNGSYPVYIDIYGGDKKCTLIRKISGDVLALKDELEKVTWGQKVIVKAGHLRINGQWKWRIVHYLHKMGF